MRDTYTETLIPANPTPAQNLLRAALMVLLAVSVIAALMMGWIFWIAAAVIGFALYRVMMKTGTEYEYVHTNEVFDVDAVIQNSRRKQMFSVTMDQILMVAPADDDEIASFGSIAAKNYAGAGDGESLYAMVYAKDGVRHKALLRLDKRMLKSLKLWIPGKCKFRGSSY